MSKRIGIIAEDKSDVEVVIHIIGKYVDRGAFTIRKFVGNGCGKLRNKCDRWAATLFQSGCDHVMVFHDLDRHDKAALKALLRRKVPADRYPRSVVIIPIEEMEAWLLSDERAIQETFGLKKPPPRIENCEAIKSPKEYLAQVVWSIGKTRYLNTAHNERIAERVSIDNLRRCSSFLELDAYIRTSIFKQSNQRR
jgi:hypothetical protein